MRSDVSREERKKSPAISSRKTCGAITQAARERTSRRFNHGVQAVAARSSRSTTPIKEMTRCTYFFCVFWWLQWATRLTGPFRGRQGTFFWFFFVRALGFVNPRESCGSRGAARATNAVAASTYQNLSDAIERKDDDCDHTCKTAILSISIHNSHTISSKMSF